MQRIEPFYLDDRHFAAAIAIALLVHLLLFTAWQMIPAAQVAEIPVRVLNLKLGDIENIPDLPSGENEVTSLSVEQELSHQMDNAAPAVPAKPSTAVWKMIKKAISQPRLPAPSAQEAERPQPTPPTEQTAQADAAKKIEDNSALAAALAHAAQQFVRQQPSFDYRPVPGAARGAGSPLGNSTRSDAEEATRYEQIISAWMDKFKYLPAEADKYNLPTSGTLRIEIDRKGDLRRSSIEHSTGYVLLDRVMIDMARRANPFPAAPKNYAADSPLLAFVTTVTFRQHE